MTDEPALTSALIVVDVLNPYEHEDAQTLATNMRAVVEPIAALLARARDEDVPIVYVNDNYGDWNSSSGELLETALAGRHPELVAPLRPPDDASFVIKARHSVFYETPLEYLLRQLGASRIVLCGQVTEQCILYSALDAYVRRFEIAIPSDAVAHIDAELADAALRMMARNMRAEVHAGTRLAFST